MARSFLPCIVARQMHTIPEAAEMKVAESPRPSGCRSAEVTANSASGMRANVCIFCGFRAHVDGPGNH